jgi:hypothetical protein
VNSLRLEGDAPMLEIGIWKMAGTAMASALVTGAAAWMSFGAGTVSRADMESYVHSAITVEREIGSSSDELLKEVSTEFRSFRVEQEGTNARLETLIEILQK